MVRLLRSMVRGAVFAISGWLHPVHRRLARRALSGGTAPRSVLFLCLGNVCRSPYAQAAFHRMAPDIPVDSAGFIGPNRPAASEAQRVARERGLDLSAHVSKVVRRELVRRFDLIVVMEPRQRTSLKRLGLRARVAVLGDLDPTDSQRRGITDPWGKEPDIFRASFDRIDRCLAELRAFLVAPTPERD